MNDTMVAGGKLPLMGERQRRNPLREVRKRRQWNIGSPGRLNVYLLQKIRALPPLLFERQHDMVLVDRLVHRRDLPLAESVVERAVDGLGGQAETRCRIAIHHHVRRKTGILQVGTDIRYLRKLAHSLQNLRPPFAEQVANPWLMQEILILAVGLPSADADILIGTEEDRA